MRRDAIYPSIVVGKPVQEDAWLGKATERIFLPAIKMTVPEIVKLKIALIGPGDFAGEVSLALHTTRTRAAQAKEDSEVLVIPAASFDELAAEQPALGSQLIEAFEDRMAAREEAAAEES